MLVLTGCAAGNGAGAGAGGEVASRSLAMPMASQALAIANRYDRLNNQANAGLDPGLLARVETEVALRQDVAGYRILAALRELRPEPFVVTQRTVHVPASVPGGQRQWFMAEGREDAAGRPVAHLEVFVDSGDGWKAARLAHGDPTDVPRLAGQPQAAVEVGPSSLATLPVTPVQAAAAVSAALSGRPGSAGVRLRSSAALRGLLAFRPQVPTGVRTTTLRALADAPVYGLRTADGGALLMLVVEETRTLTAPPGRVIGLAGTAASAFVGARGRSSLAEHRVYSLAVYVPGGRREVTVVGYYAGLVDAQAN